MSKDSSGFSITIGNVVKVTNKSSQFYNQKGIIKNFGKNNLFLWDPKFLEQSGGIFVEHPRNITIQGHEFIRTDQNNIRGASNNQSQGKIAANPNRIQRHKLLNKYIIVIRGEFKG